MSYLQLQAHEDKDGHDKTAINPSVGTAANEMPAAVLVLSDLILSQTVVAEPGAMASSRSSKRLKAASPEPGLPRAAAAGAQKRNA
jgi:hypothetical protein